MIVLKFFTKVNNVILFAFATVTYFNSSLIFVIKARAYPSGDTFGTPLKS